MARTCAVSAVVSVLLVSTGGVASVQASGPPPSLARVLTPEGRVIWNLDALLNDTFGKNRVSCYDARRGTFFSAARSNGCPAPWQRFLTFHFVFRNVHDSEFRLVHPSKVPLLGVTNIPVLIRGRYVTCPHGQYHHGRTGWLVGGGDTPVGVFWCN